MCVCVCVCVYAYECNREKKCRSETYLSLEDNKTITEVEKKIIYIYLYTL